MLSHETAIMTGRVLRAAIAAVIVALTVTACGISGLDPAACKAALQAEYVKAMAGEGHFGLCRPSARDCRKLRRSGSPSR